MNGSVTTTRDPIGVILSTGVCPIVARDDTLLALIEEPEPYAKALADGGAPVLEVAYRDERVPRAVQNALPKFTHLDVSLGVGSIVHMRSIALRTLCASAQFIVGQAYDKEVERFAGELRLPYVPGVYSTQDFKNAIEAGHRVLKFYPAENRRKGLADMKGSFRREAPDLKIIAAGIECPDGKDVWENLEDWYQVVDAVVYQSQIFPKELFTGKRDWGRITAHIAELVQQVAAIRRVS